MDHPETCCTKKGSRKHTSIVSKKQFGKMEHLPSEGKISRKVRRAKK
jgi:hypothetical protein